MLSAVRPAPSEPRTLSAARWQTLMRGLAAADIVAPLERLDESLVLLGRLAGFLATTAYVKISPPPVRGPWLSARPQLPVPASAELCTGAAAAAACRRAVAQAAPDDVRLHEQAGTRNQR